MRQISNTLPGPGVLHGEMADLVQRHDWSKNPLGAMAQWPQSLRTAVDLILGSPMGMIILWGPSLIQIYNDGYRRVMSRKHPAGLGQPTRECWPEVWAFNGPIYEAVFRGESRLYTDQRLTLARSGVDEDVWFDLTYSPLRDEAHAIAGVLVTVVEVTGRFQADQRRAFRLDLETRLRTLHEPEAVMAEASEALGLHLGAGQVAYAHIAPSGDLAVIDRDWNDGTIPSNAGRHPLESLRTLFGSSLDRGETLFVDDVQTDPRTGNEAAQAVFAGRSIRSFINVPLLKHGRLATIFAVHQARPRHWSPEDVALAEEVAERTWAAVERARAERALRESEQRLLLAMEIGRLAAWDWNLSTGEVTWSDEHFRVLGYAVGEVEPSYEAWARRVHPDDLPGTEAALLAAREDEADYVHHFRTRAADGTVRWCDARGRYFRGSDGRPLRMIGVMRDVTQQRQWEERQQVMIAELHHRTRNLIAVVQSLSAQLLATSDGLDTFGARFNDRLAALSRVQDHLSRPDEVKPTLGTLVSTELEALGGGIVEGQIEMAGPDVPLRRSTVQILALVIHELSTNARKYGALATPAGRLSVVWRVTADGEGADGGRLVIDWTERLPAGQEVPLPRGGGYGRKLIERALPYTLGAETDYDLTKGGLTCRISLPLTVLAARQAGD